MVRFLHHPGGGGVCIPDARVFAERAAPFGLIMWADHPLAERSSVTVDEVSAYPLVRTIDARAGHSLLDQEMASLSIQLSTHIFTNALFTAKLSHKALGEYKIGLIVSAASSINPVKHLFLSVAERHLKTLKFDA